MSSNYADIQYLNLLRRIVVENAKPDVYFDRVKKMLYYGEISPKIAYDLITDGNNIELSKILGEMSMDRTKKGTYKILGHMMRFNLKDGFPLITTKKVPPSQPLGELYWIISGSSNIEPLLKENIHIWTKWPYANYIQTCEKYKEKPLIEEEFEVKKVSNSPFSMTWKDWSYTNYVEFCNEYTQNPLTEQQFEERILSDKKFAAIWGELGPVYGSQWRNFGGHDLFKKCVEDSMGDEDFCTVFSELTNKYNIPWNGSKGVDQLSQVIQKLITNPNDRRNLLFAYNPSEVNQQLLPSCLAMYQFYVKDGKLSVKCTIRSQDTFLGCPFDIASGAALTHMLAQVTGYGVGEYVHVSGDTHIYSDHVKQVQEQLSREPYDMPTLELDPSVKDIEGFNKNTVKVKNYTSHPAIKAEISV